MTDVPALIVVDDETFEREVIKSPLPVVVDFFAEWCMPCKTAEPLLAELSRSLFGRVKFTRVNVQDAGTTTQSFGIHSLPTYLFVDRGKERGREIGPVGPTEFRTILRRYFAFA